MIARRAALGWLTASLIPGGLSAARPARAGAPTCPPDADPSAGEIDLGTSPWRALLVRSRPEGRPPPRLLVLLHGMGEAADPALGIRAWLDRYGLATAISRLCRPPLMLTPEQAAFIEPNRLSRINAALGAEPFAPFPVLCPHTPNPHASARPSGLLDDYADWLERTLLPAARRQLGLAESAPVGLDGCSMGGHVAAEVFVRKPHIFQTFGMVQPAFGGFRVRRYATRIARCHEARNARPRVHLQTSTRDPYRHVVRQLSEQLAQRRVEHDLDVLPGPHGQPWLRAAGTLHMLWWHHRALT